MINDESKDQSRHIAVLPATALIVLGLGGAAQAADTTVVVTPTNPAGFASTDDTTPDATAALSETPPKGSARGPGYVQMNTPGQNDKADFRAYNENRPLSELTAASYEVFRSSASTGRVQNRPTLQLPITRNLNGPGTSFTNLIFEPEYCYSDASLLEDVWQTFEGDHDGGPGEQGCWHYSAAADTYYPTLAAATAVYPNATLIGKGFTLGSGQPGVISRVDTLALTFGAGNTTTYDFEASDPAPPEPDLTADIAGVSRNEGNTGTTAFDFVVTLNRASTTPTTINYSTNNGTAVAGIDYVGATGELVIPAGQTSGTITIQVNGDTTVEPNEGFFVNITSPDAGLPTSTRGSGTIVNDDATTPPPTSKPSVAIADVSTAEGNSGTHAAYFKVTLNKKYSKAVTVQFKTVAGTASASAGDFVSKTGSLMIPANTLSKSISVSIKGDKKKENDETFTVTIYNPTNATISDPNGQGVIRNDDR